eukprot:CAMPEP_0176023158 /NCGR_PEP_ID=MMETSP0120_2-20121206/11291_1 /TAXON_ID=160619 /ORGANISM="Kryptoperidinium foliaceum, Strain CCMP 1326" /LENGTH=180 /DNA_ID=CAMNT_0017356315 /DNA_START=136 /DNA_END=674 /DNA_ORIENTATION=-
MAMVWDVVNHRTRWMTLEQDVVHAAGFLLVLIGSCRLTTIVGWTLELWYFSLSLVILAFNASSTDDMFQKVCWLSYAQRSVYALIPCSTLSVVVANVFHVVAIVWVYSARGLGARDTSESFDTLGFTLVEIACSAAAFGFAWCLQKSTTTGLKRDLKTKILMSQNSATRRLLSLMCDVVT